MAIILEMVIHLIAWSVSCALHREFVRLLASRIVHQSWVLPLEHLSWVIERAEVLIIVLWLYALVESVHDGSIFKLGPSSETAWNTHHA